MTGTLTIATDDRGVATVTLDRPQRHNALDAPTIAALHTAAETLGSDPAVRVVVLTGQGESFSAGADLDWMRAQAAATRAQRMAEAGRLAAMLAALEALPKPLIARVNGQAFGGGLGLMACADIAIAQRPGRFAFSEVRLGLTPATIAPYVLMRMGEARAREVFFSGRIFDADEAVRLGLAAEAVDANALDTAIERHVKPFLAGAPGAVAVSKALCRQIAPRPDPRVIEATIDALADRWETKEAAEGIAAFFEKRRADWGSCQ